MSSNLGVGVSPVGSAPYGFGTPAVAPTPGGAVNRLSSGAQTGSPKLSLDFATRGQYVFDEFGRRTGQNDIEHMVTIALGTIRGTCVVKRIGHRFREIRKITDSFEQEMRVRVEEALALLLERDLISIDDISVTPMQGSPALTRVIITDRATGAQIEQLI